tara:strand:- start:33 stop:446 length:414 start_codon:yes stop_codon:yes gene_type:complete
MGVVGAALRGFGKALGKKESGKAIKSVPIAKRLTERRKDTESLFKIRHKHGIDPVKADIQEAVKKTSKINTDYDKAVSAMKTRNKKFKRKVIGGASAAVGGAVGAMEVGKRKSPKFKKFVESSVTIKDGKLKLKPKK